MKSSRHERSPTYPTMPHIQHSFTSGGGPFLQSEKSRLVRPLTLHREINDRTSETAYRPLRIPRSAAYFNGCITPNRPSGSRTLRAQRPVRARARRPPTTRAQTASHALLGGRFDHHAHDRLGAGRPHQHAALALQRGGLRLDRLPHRGGRRQRVAVGDRHVRPAPAGSLRHRRAAASGRSPSACSSSSAAAMPSPDGVSRMSTMWPDCSPPRTHPRSDELVHDVAVADVRRRDLDPGVAHRLWKPKLVITVTATPLPASSPRRFQVERDLGDDLVAVDDGAVGGHRQHPVAVAVEGEADVVPALAHPLARSHPCAWSRSPR